jgi:hypothetical protein
MMQKKYYFHYDFSCKKVLLSLQFLRVKKCHFHYDMQKSEFSNLIPIDSGRLSLMNQSLYFDRGNRNTVGMLSPAAFACISCVVLSPEVILSTCFRLF